MVFQLRPHFSSKVVLMYSLSQLYFHEIELIQNNYLIDQALGHKWNSFKDLVLYCRKNNLQLSTCSVKEMALNLNSLDLRYIFKVYLYKKWKFKLIEKFVRMKMYKQSPPLYFPLLASLLPFPFCSVNLYVRKREIDPMSIFNLFTSKVPNFFLSKRKVMWLLNSKILVIENPKEGRSYS